MTKRSCAEIPPRAAFRSSISKQGGVIALDCVNATNDVAHGRTLVANCSSASPERLADPRIRLNS